MTTNDYRGAFETSKTDYERALARRDNAERELMAATKEVMTLKRAVVALAALCGEEDYEDTLGLTESVRLIFNETDKVLLLPEIKNAMEGLGVSFAGLKNPDASVLSVLNRLQGQGGMLIKVPRIDKTPDGKAMPKFGWKRRGDPK